jgi:hypothetical protein
MSHRSRGCLRCRQRRVKVINYYEPSFSVFLSDYHSATAVDLHVNAVSPAMSYV